MQTLGNLVELDELQLAKLPIMDFYLGIYYTYSVYYYYFYYYRYCYYYCMFLYVLLLFLSLLFLGKLQSGSNISQKPIKGNFLAERMSNSSATPFKKTVY